jgi:hypothetical protein
MKTAFELLKDQLEVNKQLFKLGMITDVEKICQDVRAKALYTTQKKDEQ